MEAFEISEQSVVSNDSHESFSQIIADFKSTLQSLKDLINEAKSAESSVILSKIDVSFLELEKAWSGFVNFFESATENDKNLINNAARLISATKPILEDLAQAKKELDDGNLKASLQNCVKNLESNFSAIQSRIKDHITQCNDLLNGNISEVLAQLESSKKDLNVFIAKAKKGILGILGIIAICSFTLGAMCVMLFKKSGELKEIAANIREISQELGEIRIESDSANQVILAISKEKAKITANNKDILITIRRK